MKTLLGIFQKGSLIPLNRPVLSCLCCWTLMCMSQTDPTTAHHCILLPVIRPTVYFIEKLSPEGLKCTQAKKPSLDWPPSFVLYLQKWERTCCFCSSNEMPSDLFMNYLFGTAPLCSVHFLSSLESCRSVIADATLCHPEFALTSCEPSGRSISILACPWVYWGWEWLIKQVWASTPILLHAKQELSSS